MPEHKAEGKFYTHPLFPYTFVYPMY